MSIVLKSGSLKFLEPSEPAQARNRISLLYLLDRLLWFVGGVRASVSISVRNGFCRCVAGCGAQRGSYLVTGS